MNWFRQYPSRLLPQQGAEMLKGYAILLGLAKRSLASNGNEDIERRYSWNAVPVKVSQQ